MNEKNSKWKVFVVAFVLVFAGFAAMMATPTVLAQNPTVTTEPAYDITPHTAVLNMSFEMDTAEEVTVWFAYNETGEDLNITAGEATYGPGNTTHQTEVTGLVPETTYDFEAYLEYFDEDLNDTVIEEGGVLDFITLEVVNEPTITTEEAEVLGSSSAEITMHYELNDAAEAHVWFAYNYTGDVLDIEVGEMKVVEDGNQTVTLEGLEPWTDYNFTAIIAYVNETEELQEADQAEERTFLTGAGASIDGPTFIPIDDEFTYEADVIGEADSYSWAILEDDVVLDTGEDASISYTFDSPRSYTIFLEIEDIYGVNDTAILDVDTYFDLNITVVDRETTDPIESADLSVNEVEKVTDENGFVQYTEIPQDFIGVFANHYEYYTFNEEYRDITSVDAPNATFELTIELEPRDEFFVNVGRVIDYYTREPLDEALVTLTNETGVEFTGETNEDGMAYIEVLENPFEVTYDVTVSREIGDFLTYPSPVGLGPGNAPEYGEVELVRGLFRVGPVLDAETDEAIRDVELTVQLGDDRYEGVTDAVGTFDVQFGPDEIYGQLDSEIGVSFQKYEYFMKAETYNYPSTDEVYLQPKEEFAIFVGPIVDELDGEYRSLEGVEVTINHEEIDPMTDYTDFDGEAIFYVNFDPRRERFSLEASLEGYETIETTFVGTETGRIVMEIPTYNVEVGSVMDQDGRFVEGASVTLSHGNNVLGVELTDETGFTTFEISVDPEGTTFEYSITKEGYEDAEGSFTGASSGDIEIIREEELPVEEAEFEVTNFNVDPTSGEAPLEVTITANIENVGGEEGTIRLFAGGRVVNSWTLDAGESVSVDETYEFDSRGTFNVELGDQRVTVEVEDDDVEVGISTAMLAGIGLIIIIIIIIIAVMMMKKDDREPEEEFGEEEELFEEEEFGEEEFGEEEELFEEEEEFGEEEELFEEEEEFGEELEEDEELFEEEEFDEELEEDEELFEEEEFDEELEEED